MAISTITRIDKIVAGTPSLDLSQIKSQSAQVNNEQTSEFPGGHLYPLFTGPLNQKPVFNFQTSQLDTLLGGVGIGGAALVNADLYQKIATSTGTTARATLAHNRFRISEGLIYWSTINLAHNQIGTADVVCAANYDGSNNPITATGSLALAGNLTNALNFGLGPASYNGVSLPGIQEITIDSGITLTQEGAASELWDTFTGIETVTGTITIRLREPVNINTYPLVGTAAAAGLVFYARKISSTGRVADITAEHIKFTAADGVLVPDQHQGDGAAPTTDTLMMHLVAASDSTVPLTIATSSAIT